MSLGTSIFLSAILLGIISLFIATKDRWNWKRIAFWPIAIFISITVVAGVIFWIYSVVTELPHKQTIFWNLPLKAIKSDVKFLKGEPSRVDNVKNKGDVWVFISKKGYSDDEPLYLVYFKDNKLYAILYSGPYLGSPGIQGLDIGSPQETITEKFGTPSYVDVSDDELRRLQSYEKFNVFFYLRENKVYAFGMYDPASGPMQFEHKETSGAKK